MEPKVTIIIPVYNTALLLPRCLHSVVNQTLKETEIICVNDGSTDHSLSVLQDWADKDKRITIINQENGRQGKARNAAMAVAQGEYIGMIDSDDYIPDNYFETLYNTAKSNNAEIAICGIIKEKPTGNRTVIEFKESIVATTTEEKLQICKCPPEFHPVNKLYRREMLERIGLRFAEGVQYEDVMFVFRAICESNRLATVPNLFYRYVLNSSSTVKSKQTEEKQLQKYRAHKSMTDYALKNNISVSNRYRNITVKQESICGLTLWKIKEKENKRTLRLFDALPLWCWNSQTDNTFDEPIDLVYTWVDGNDPAWHTERNRYMKNATAETAGNNSEARWIENDELKFSLRSVEKYAPWINSVYIVTNGQIPEWLDTSDPRIKMVFHKEIMPLDALPTFNSTAIESCIHNIPNLSEHFILGNDDMMFTDYVNKSDFFHHDGKTKIYLNGHKFNKEKARQKGNYAVKLARMQTLIESIYGKKIEYAPHHCFDAYRKSLFKDGAGTMNSEWNRTAYSRFRNDSDMHRSFIGYYMIATGKASMEKVGRYNRIYGLLNRLKALCSGKFATFSRCIPVETKDYHYVLKKYNPLMICMNDGENATDDDRKRMVEFLQSLFPQKSSFEK